MAVTGWNRTPVRIPSELTLLEFEKPIAELEAELRELKERCRATGADLTQEIAQLQAKIEQTQREIASGLTPWQRVLLARHPQRPYFLDFLSLIAEDFLELHGDRLYGEDRAIVTGLAKLLGRGVVVIGQQKGRDLKENLLRNFGSAHPEGYRKALRMMKLAERFRLPILSFVDTPGAYPGIGAEERHIAQAIAVNLREMFLLEVPIVATILSEGGSGGALGIAVADRVLMLENAYYSVISPEGCAAILWRDRGYASQAAEALKLTARDLKEMGVVDRIVPEPLGGAHRDWEGAARLLEEALGQELSSLEEKPVDQLLQERYERFRRYGVFIEDKATFPSEQSLA